MSQQLSSRAIARDLEGRRSQEAGILAPPLQPGPSLTLGVTSREVAE